MTVYFLYYLSEDGLPPQDDWQSQMTRADQIIGIFNWVPVFVEPAGLISVSKGDAPIIVRSLQEALAHPDLINLQWVWMDQTVTDLLQDFVHPSDNVIYCIGHDRDGFNVAFPLGQRLRIWTPDSSRQYYAETVLHLVVYDRALKSKAWQSQ